MLKTKKVSLLILIYMIVKTVIKDDAITAKIYIEQTDIETEIVFIIFMFFFIFFNFNATVTFFYFLTKL